MTISKDNHFDLRIFIKNVPKTPKNHLNIIKQITSFKICSFNSFYKIMIKRIAIYGGAFDPPHKGHIEIIKNLANIKEIDQVWLMPCGDRQDKKLLLSMEKRFKLMRTIFKEIQQIKISDEEIQLSKSYKKAIHTYDLLNLLKNKYINTKFYFVIGGDILHTIHTWGNAQKLIQQNAFIYFHRKGFSFLQEKLPKDTKIVEVDLPEISSSAIKKNISDSSRSKQSKLMELKEWVSQQVLTLLQEQKLI